jgi:NAD-dependent dihydropyrimidine dehydrogenase PreA subunit
MVRKTREYGKKLFCKRRRNYRGVQKEIHENSYKDVLLRIHEQSIRIQEDMELKDDDVHNCGYCMFEVEKVMEELCEKGEFGFGSFWGRKEPWGFHKVVNDHNGDSFERYQIIELGCT